MSLSLIYKDSSIHSLIDIAMAGHYPLFLEEWISHCMSSPKKSLTKKDRLKAKEIINRLNRHKGIERKKVILMDLHEDERNNFVRVFLEIVENKIIDAKPGIH